MVLVAAESDVTACSSVQRYGTVGSGAIFLVASSIISFLYSGSSFSSNIQVACISVPIAALVAKYVA